MSELEGKIIRVLSLKSEFGGKILNSVKKSGIWEKVGICGKKVGIRRKSHNTEFQVPKSKGIRLWIGTRRKALQAALVNPDVTGLMDGWAPAVCNNMSISVAHCLALSHDCVCSQSTASLLCVLPSCSQKEKKDSRREKRGACVSSLAARVLPPSETARLPLSSVSYIFFF